MSSNAGSCLAPPPPACPNCFYLCPLAPGFLVFCRRRSSPFRRRTLRVLSINSCDRSWHNCGITLACYCCFVFFCFCPILLIQACGSAGRPDLVLRCLAEMNIEQAPGKVCQRQSTPLHVICVTWERGESTKPRFGL